MFKVKFSRQDLSIEIECQSAPQARMEFDYYFNLLNGSTSKTRAAAPRQSINAFLADKKVGKGTKVLGMAAYLHHVGKKSFTRSDLSACYKRMQGKQPNQVAMATMSRLVKDGKFKKVSRGKYKLTDAGIADLNGDNTKPKKRIRSRRDGSKKTDPAVFHGIGKFLEAAPFTRGWRRILLCAYFLTKKGRQHFSVGDIERCFRRANSGGPKRVAAAIYNTLRKRNAVESAGRGRHRVTEEAMACMDSDERVQRSLEAANAKTKMAVVENRSAETEEKEAEETGRQAS